MSDNSKIEWTDASWNPVTGCSKVSPGCAYCYIERTPAFRIAGRRFVRGATGVRLHTDRLDQPIRWQRPRRIFVNSLSDLFHQDVRDAFIAKVFTVMALTPRHTYQILTKRPERMRAFLRGDEPVKVCLLAGTSWPLPNVWLGVSAENQRWADERIPILLDTPAAVRFVSCEPLLGPMQLRRHVRCWCGNPSDDCTHEQGHLAGHRGLDWVILGGESGPRRREMRVEWLTSIVQQCQDAGVSVFVKQDSGPRPGTQGRIPDELWAVKEYPR